MSDNLDDDNLDMDDASFDDFNQKSGTLGDLWRNNPLVKIGIVVAAVVVIFSVIVFFGSEKDKIEPSMVSSAPDITAPPGTEGATPEYIEAIKEENEQRLQTARKEGTSALPTPIEPPRGGLSVPEEQEEAEDPLQRWRRLQEERLERELQQQEVVAPEPVPEDTTRSEAIQALSDLMSEQMSSILEKKSEVKLSHLSITDVSALEDLNKAEEAGEGDGFEEVAIGQVLFPAGQIAYAMLLTEANTDVPGPVLAEIVSGPLKGYRILGSFVKNKELLTLNFDTIVMDGISKDIDAVALDPDTTLPGMASDVDHHYLTRVVMPIAAAFVQGAADAIANTGRTSVTVQGETVAQQEDKPDTKEEIASGVEEAGQELKTILEDIASDTEVTVRLKTGTPMGVLFLESLTDEDDI